MARVLAPIHAVAVPLCIDVGSQRKSAAASASSSTSTSCGCADSAAAELAVVFHAALPSTTTARALMPPQALASGLSRTRTGVSPASSTGYWPGHQGNDAGIGHRTDVARLQATNGRVYLYCVTLHAVHRPHQREALRRLGIFFESLASQMILRKLCSQ